jgi:cysteine/O-acetylserine efflux protein
MTGNLFPLISFILISTFTPGPSNISTASTAVLHGYKNSLKFQAGLAAGVFILMLLSGLLSTTLLRVFPAFEPIMRYIGAGYVLYLAFAILKASYTFNEQDAKPLGLMHGFMLQILNPKLFVYAFTLFSAFLATMTGNVIFLILIAILLAAVSFCATSLWAVFGTAIKTHLHNPRLNKIINISLSLLLIYSAISITGLI